MTSYTCTGDVAPTPANLPGYLMFTIPASAEVSSPGTAASVSIPVCDQPDGTQGALNWNLANNPQGCVSAQTLCCPGSTAQCMLGSSQTISNIGSIQVPCGATVTTSFDDKCTASSQTSMTILGSKVPTVLSKSTAQTSQYPYSFQVTLAPGYECSNGDLVDSDTKKRPCVDDDSISTKVAKVSTASKGLSRTEIFALVCAATIFLVAIYYVLHLPPSREALTVKQIVQKSGLDAMILAPKSRAAKASAAGKASAAAKASAAGKAS